jgi:Carboxypeptidase regulatory-like domain
MTVSGRRRVHPSLAVCAALLWASSPALAEGGVITGRVLDAQDQPLKGVEVTLLHSGDKNPRKLTADDQGAFRFGDLPSGVYSVAADLDGYSQVICPGFRLMTGLSRAFEIHLMPTDGGKSSTCKIAEPGG